MCTRVSNCQTKCTYNNNALSKENKTQRETARFFPLRSPQQCTRPVLQARTARQGRRHAQPDIRAADARTHAGTSRSAKVAACEFFRMHATVRNSGHIVKITTVIRCYTFKSLTGMRVARANLLLVSEASSYERDRLMWVLPVAHARTIYAASVDNCS